MNKRHRFLVKRGVQGLETGGTGVAELLELLIWANAADACARVRMTTPERMPQFKCSFFPMFMDSSSDFG